MGGMGLEKPVKVLQIGMTDNIGGMESYLMSQYRKLNRNIVSYDFLNITGESQIVFSDEIKDNGDEIFSVPSRHNAPVLHYFEVFKLLYIKRREYKYVVLNTCSLYYVFPLLAAALVGIPHRVIHSHNSGDEVHENRLRKYLKKMNNVILKFSATDYWACSKMAGRWMFGSHSFQVIHNAIDTRKYIFNPDIRNRIRKQLQLEDKFVIGNVARFSPQKNHEFLIEIFNEIAKKKDNAILMLIGDSAGFINRLEMIKHKVKVYHLEEKVMFMGMRNDTNELYQAMDCHVLPSKFEGLSITALEAQASGMPCFGSTALSEETKIAKNFYTIALDKKPIEWATFIINNCSYKRVDMLECFIQKGYDIHKEISKMESIYTN